MQGKRFGRWTVIGDVVKGTHNIARKVECLCDCGNTAMVIVNTLKRGSSTSCGCRRTDVAKTFHITHGGQRGGSKTPTYLSWDNMMQRCNSINRDEYFYYGARGITVCERWQTFDNFLADMGERPDDKSLDRIDSNGNYEPKNCKWSTRVEQAQNKRPRSCHKHLIPPKLMKTAILT